MALARPRVAVIGAGAAGLVTLRELLAQGLDARCFERRSDCVGGTWALGGRGSAMYSSLRTNLPKQVMQFRDSPFARGTRQFPGHAEVQAYLRAYVRAHDLAPHIALGRGVVSCRRRTDAAAGGAWRLALEGGRQRGAAGDDGGGGGASHSFDAVVVANGHFSRPHAPPLPGRAAFEAGGGGRRVLHSFGYRDAVPFAGQTVVVVGAGASGVDISRELAAVCAAVHVAARGAGDSAGDRAGGTADTVAAGVCVHGEVEELLADGTVRFRGGGACRADAVVLCTGYRYHFPFLDADGLGSSGQQGGALLHETRDAGAVAPLYRHVFAAAAGGLSFVGVPFKVAPFRCMELQAQWVASVLAGRAQLPPPGAMAREAAEEREAAEARGVPAHHSHTLGQRQWAYFDALADAVGVPRHEAVPPYVRELYEQTAAARVANPDSYRDSTSFCTSMAYPL
jgi:hypothetical protein